MAEGIKVGDFTSRSRILELVFPVGSTVARFNPESPAAVLGGTWELLEEGRTLVTASDPDSADKKYKVGNVGGEEYTALSVAHIPPHSHYLPYTGSNSNVGSMSYQGNSGNGEVDANTSVTGGGQPHNNMPPYIAVHIWRRIA